jgi:trk system potassium uptake protein
MRVIIMGCGRVGSALAAQLAGAATSRRSSAAQFAVDGHDVRVVDREERARALLPAAFPGGFVVGNGYNRAVLERAGITGADAFIAVTSGDNSNIVGARIAKEVYRVPMVVARIYDPRRAEIYRDLGIPTVASVRWTVSQIQQMLLHRYLTPERSFGNGETLLVREPVSAYLAGRAATEFDVDGEIRVVEVTRLGRSSVAGHATVLAEGDVLTVAVAAEALPRLRAFLHKELGT